MFCSQCVKCHNHNPVIGCGLSASQKANMYLCHKAIPEAHFPYRLTTYHIHCYLLECHEFNTCTNVIQLEAELPADNVYTSEDINNM